MKMGCTAERARMPGYDFVEDSLKSPPLYFETDERTYQGVCCVCFKKGCLGRCPNPSCGLLMHHTCVMPAKQGGPLQCPICRVEVRCDEEEKDGELPKWHEVEVGAPFGKRAKPRLSPEVHKATFPGDRVPTDEEAQLHGFQQPTVVCVHAPLQRLCAHGHRLLWPNPDEHPYRTSHAAHQARIHRRKPQPGQLAVQASPPTRTTLRPVVGRSTVQVSA